MSDINSVIHDATIWLLIGFSIVTWVLVVVKLIQTQKPVIKVRHLSINSGKQKY